MKVHSPARAAPPQSVRAPLPRLRPAMPLARDVREYFAPRLGGLGDVHVATDDPSVAALGAKAVTIGERIAFAPGRYRPDTAPGRELIAHELIHTRQQRAGGAAPSAAADGAAEREASSLAAALAGGQAVRPSLAVAPGPARDAEDYLVSMPEENMQAQIGALAPSKLQSDIDAINEHLDRQIMTTPDTIALEERREQLQGRLTTLVRVAHTEPPKPKRGKGAPKHKRATAPVASAPLSGDAPRILREQTSMATTDPVAVKAEVDRITLWLQRSDVSAGDKAILRQELHNLAPEFEKARAEDSVQRRGARLTAAFSNPGEGAEGLRANIAKIVGIYTDPAEPGAAFIMDGAERIRISKEQAAGLRAGALTMMRDTLKRAASTAEMAWGRYDAQKEVDHEYPVVSAISAFLGGVDDPSAGMAAAHDRMFRASILAHTLLAGNDLVAAVDPLTVVSTEARRMSMAAYAWQEGLISGAESAVSKLTFIRDCSAAITIAIGAVVAAPFVAGVVAGTGATGVGATLLTMGGTGVVVGGGAGTAFGGAEVVGQLNAGASLDHALSEGGKVFKQRAGEGFAAGLGGATTRVIAKGLGTGTTALGRYSVQATSQAGGNFTGTTAGSLAQGDDLSTALTKGGRGAALGLVSTTAAAPFAKSPGLQLAVGAGVGAGVNYADARAQGATDEEALRGVAIGLATTGVTSSARTVQRDQRRYEARGRLAGRQIKPARATSGGKRRRSCDRSPSRSSCRGWRRRVDHPSPGR